MLLAESHPVAKSATRVGQPALGVGKGWASPQRTQRRSTLVETVCAEDHTPFAILESWAPPTSTPRIKLPNLQLSPLLLVYKDNPGLG
jgi:hypothetical protein